MKEKTSNGGIGFFGLLFLLLLTLKLTNFITLSWFLVFFIPGIIPFLKGLYLDLKKRGFYD